MARPVHTYSIVARDARTGELGVAVQSHWFGVGAVVPWLEAGVGAVATQSFVEPAYGPRGLGLMRSGMAAPDALAALLGQDPGAEVRQVAFLDARGRVGVHTGARAIQSAGHRSGEGWSVQANLMRSEAVVPAMARAWETSDGDLSERLMAVLDAAQAAGGDIRGRQSAALEVVRGEATGRPWADRVVDLRVDDHAEPLRELRRLLVVHRAYEHMNAGDLALERDDAETALAAYAAAAARVPDNPEVAYWHAVALAQNGRLADALPIFRRIFAEDPSWVELTRRLVAPGLLEADLAERIVGPGR